MTVTPPVRHLRAADLLAPGAVSENETAGIFSRSMELE
jgi:hypothetical protein